MNSTVYSEEFDAWSNDFGSSAVGYYILSMLTVVAIWILCNNTIILYVIKKHQHLRSYSSALVASLLFSDLVVAVYCIIYTLYYLTSPHSEQEQRFLCMATNFFGLLGYTLSGFCLAAAIIERYLKICHPFLYERIMSWRMVAALIVVPYGLTFTLVLVCIIDNIYQDRAICGPAHNVKFEYLVFLNILAVLYITFLVVLTIRMLLVIRRHQKAIQQQHQGNGDEVKEHNKSKTLGLMTLFLFVSYFPLTIFLLVLAIREDLQTSSYFAMIGDGIVTTFSMSNNVMNSVVYGWRDREVKDILKRMLLKRKTNKVEPINIQQY